MLHTLALEEDFSSNDDVKKKQSRPDTMDSSLSGSGGLESGDAQPGATASLVVRGGGPLSQNT